MSKLFFDIETVPSEDFSVPVRPVSVEPKPVPGNIKDPEKIKARKKKNEKEAKKKQKAEEAKAKKRADDNFRKHALDPWRGQIVSFAYAIDDGEVRCCVDEQRDEAALLQSIADVLRTFDNEPIWVGYNIKNFDLAFLAARFMVHGIQPPLSIPWDAKEWDHDRVHDVCTLIPYNKHKYVSQRVLCQALGVDEPVGSGDMVYDQWCAGRIDSIVEHNMSDVQAVRSLYHRITN